MSNNDVRLFYIAFYIICVGGCHSQGQKLLFDINRHIIGIVLVIWETAQSIFHFPIPRIPY
jgi:hypothetical protein